MARVLVISASDLSRDARVDRQIEFLVAEHEVVAAGFGRPGHGASGIELSQPRRLTPRWLCERLAMELMRTVCADIAAYWMEPGHREWRRALLDVRPDVVVANDMSAVPLAFVAAHGAPVVVDLHEYAPREHEQHVLWRLFVAPQLKRLLRQFLPLAGELITVNEPIADAYAEHYGRRPVVVTNAARLAEQAPSPLEPGRIRLVHHGVALRGRRLETMVDMVAQLDERFTLDLFLVGDERYRHELEQRAHPVGRVRVHPGLPMHDIVRELNSFDIGLYLLAPTNFNNLFALPNKFFDFVQARLAVAIGPSPAMAAIASRHGFGVVAESFEPQALIARLSQLDAPTIERLKRAADGAAALLSAQRNGEIVRGVVARALDERSDEHSVPVSPQPARP